MRNTTLSQVNFGNFGDSKILLHQLDGANDYILTIQNIDSTDIEIIGRKNEVFINEPRNESELTEYAIIESITKNQLAELGSFLAEKFPK